MPSQIVVENGRRIQRVAGGEDLDLGPATGPGDTGFQSKPDSEMPRWAKTLMNPELAGMATSLAGDFAFPEKRGASVMARVGKNVVLPAAVGAATSVGRDLIDGERDPQTIFGHAAMHTGINAIPGVGGEAVRALKGVPAAADAAIGTLTGGVKGGLAATLKSMLGMGEKSTGTRVMQMASPLADTTLPGGIKLLSRDGLKMLVQKSIDLDNTPGAASPATKQALEKMIEEVRQAIHPENLAPKDLFSSVGFNTGSAAADAATAATTRAQQAAMKLAQRVRLALGMTTAGAGTANDALGGP